VNAALPQESFLQNTFGERGFQALGPAAIEEQQVSELDEAWGQALAEAQRRATAAGRRDVADYLRLRASNDLLRQTSIEWLLETFTILAGKANRRGASIQIAKEEIYRFPIGNSTMVGPLLTLVFGVRALSVEAGWPRTPSDGFVRGGGLACARIRHRGRKSVDEDLMLVRSDKDAPRWMVIDKKTDRHSELLEAGIQKHLTKMLAENYR
jgi:hypothetical protein